MLRPDVYPVKHFPYTSAFAPGASAARTKASPTMARKAAEKFTACCVIMYLCLPL